MNRFMSRLITRAKLPVWYTEGFNQHVYMNFAVPLSLGYEGHYEILEISIKYQFNKIDGIESIDSSLLLTIYKQIHLGRRYLATQFFYYKLSEIIELQLN